MRFNFRLKVSNLTFFAMVAKTQTLEGVASRQSDGKHFLMWDIENATLQQAKETLRRIQVKYGLSNIYLVSDKSGSYRAWCFNRVRLETLLAILAESLSILDYGFFYYTVKRKSATLRTSRKLNRPDQKLIGVLESYECPIPSFMERVVYDTGSVKQGRSLLFGGE